MTGHEVKQQAAPAVEPATQPQAEPAAEPVVEPATEVPADAPVTESRRSGDGGETDEAPPAADPQASTAFQPLEDPTTPNAGENIDLLLDVTVALSIELGGAEMPLRDILALGPGSVVKLERAVGEPVDILINRELVGRGEVVVVDDRLGVRVTELLKPPSGT